MVAFRQYQMEAANAIARSRSRRERVRRQRRFGRLLLMAAVAGGLLIGAYVLTMNPGTRWYFGLSGILLLTPYLVWRLD